MRMDFPPRIVLNAMSKILTAEYDAEHNMLRLAEPLDSVKDGDTVDVIITKHVDPLRPWLALSGIMSKEQGDDFARALEQLEEE